MPVPGPIMTAGVDGSSLGDVRLPRWKDTLMGAPTGRDASQRVQTPWRVFLMMVRYFTTAARISTDDVVVALFRWWPVSQDAIEKRRSRSWGMTSRIMEGGIETLLNSWRTSRMLRRGRVV